MDGVLRNPLTGRTFSQEEIDALNSCYDVCDHYENKFSINQDKFKEQCALLGLTDQDARWWSRQDAAGSAETGPSKGDSSVHVKSQVVAVTTVQGTRNVSLNRKALHNRRGCVLNAVRVGFSKEHMHPSPPNTRKSRMLIN